DCDRVAPRDALSFRHARYGVPSGSRSSPTSVQPLSPRRKYVRTGRRHFGCAALSTEMSTLTKLPDAVGNPRGASIVVVAPCVSEIGCVPPVALSNRNQAAW